MKTLTDNEISNAMKDISNSIDLQIEKIIRFKDDMTKNEIKEQLLLALVITYGKQLETIKHDQP